MSNYNDPFSNGLVPPSEMGFNYAELSGNTQTYWAEGFPGTGVVLSEILEVSALVVGSSLTLPPANSVSEGASSLVRNVGSSAVVVYNAGGVALTTLAAGTAQLLYVKDNASPNGVWGSILYGVGSANISAGQLAGNGTKATESTLSVASPVLITSGNLTLTPAHRGSTLEFNGGSASLNLGYSATYGNDLYCFVKNAGSGLVNIVASSGELVDGAATLGLQPDESLILVCTGSGNWLTIGRGRSILYQFSNLSLDVSAGGTFTLTAAQASNKMMTFNGNPSGTVTIVVPTTVSVYYVANNLSTPQAVIVKTASLPGATVGQTQRAVLLCDGSSVTAAQSVVVNSALSMLDGSEAAPSLNYSSQSNTGLYKYSALGIGVTVNGVTQMYAPNAASGVEFPLGLSYGGIRIKTSNTGSLTLPVGTTAQRDSVPGMGYTRWNSTLGKQETWNGTAWTLGGGATGGGSDDVFYENSKTVTASYSITTGKNAMSAGPISIADGATVTVPDGSVWSIV